MMEAVLLLAAIAQRFRLEAVPGHPVVPVPGFTLRPKQGIKMVVHRRSSPLLDQKLELVSQLRA
jgi:cytochrome P450